VQVIIPVLLVVLVVIMPEFVVDLRPGLVLVPMADRLHLVAMQTPPARSTEAVALVQVSV
jgi:hypothetical protein